MKLKYFCFLTILFIFSSLRTQTNYELNTMDLYETKVIYPSWDNIIKLTFCSMQDFTTIMKKYNYGSSSGQYIANTSAGSPYYTFSKTTRELKCINSHDSNFASFLREQIIKYGTIINRNYEDSYEVFTVKYVYSGLSYILKIYIRESNTGSSSYIIVKN